MPFLPAHAAPVLTALMTSLCMTGAVSAIATWRAIGSGPDFMDVWPMSWLVSWAIAFPVMLCIQPLARRLAARLTERS
jgi:hypothetical protein